MDRHYIDGLIDTSRRVLASGAIGTFGHHRSPDLAVLVGGVVEEAAQAALSATLLGGAVAIPEDLRAAALQRAMTFDAAGTRSA